MSDYFYLVTLIPLIGFLANGFFGKKINSEKVSGAIGSICVLIPFIFSVLALFQLLNMPAGERTVYINYFSWIAAGSLEIDYAFLIDPLSVVMLLVVTGIGFLIHVYSIGYMHGDPGFAKFFAFLNLFIFAMLHLVLADNFLLIFLGWEGVGLCSYLLIGFWYEHKFTGDAAKKAFVMNRIGDFGFMIAMFIIFANFGTLRVSEFLPQLSAYGINDSLLIVIGLLFFLGAAGKSAQIPLYTWLPDAMAGPTPVSALIHAATMVTAGIYLLARNSLLYAMTPVTTQTILVIAILTALVAGTIALKQNDIKKILAYSTVSQLGFMFIAIGAFAYHIAVFHLVTHAFFKALLFLGAGSVIHGMQNEQDIRNMGGLKDKMKITFITFIIGTLAIAGIPPLAGFWSKDEILYKVISNVGAPYYILVLICAGITAFYMFRLVALTFYGKPRYDKEKIHPHESPSTMTIPLIILAVLSAIGGFIGFPHFMGLPNLFEQWLAPVFANATSVFETMHPISDHSVAFELVLVAVSVVIAVSASVFAFMKFSTQETFKAESGFGKVLENKYYVDEIYDAAVVEPVRKVSDKFLWRIFDVKIIDGFVNGIANYISRLSFDWRKIQTGIIQDYTTIAVAGIVVVLIYLLML